MNKTISFVHKGVSINQKYEFRVCLDIGVASSAKSPTKPTPGAADLRIKRDWNAVKQKASEFAQHSEEGLVARSKIMSQQLVDSFVCEPSPLGTENETSLKPSDKAKAPWCFVKGEPKEKEGETEWMRTSRRRRKKQRKRRTNKSL